MRLREIFKSFGRALEDIRYKLDDQVLFVKLDDGEDFLGKICEALEKIGADSGVILSCAGMLRNILFAYFKGRVS